jgi:hypothetical protein
MLGNLLSGWINDAFDWRTAFFLVGMPWVGLALLVRLTLREPMRDDCDVKPARYAWPETETAPAHGERGLSCPMRAEELSPSMAFGEGPEMASLAHWPGDNGISELFLRSPNGFSQRPGSRRLR